MSFMHERSTGGLPPVVVGVMVYLDPRRWFGALLATLGILVSIVAPFFPAFLLKRIFPPAAGIIVPRPASVPRRPSLIYVQTAIWATSRPDAQPHSGNDGPSSPHVTFACDPHPRSASAASLAVSTLSSRQVPADSDLPSTDVKDPPLSSSPSSLTEILPPPSPPSPYFHPHGLPSLESLDLIPDISTLQTPPPSPPGAKRHFRVTLPRLAFGRRVTENAGNAAVLASPVDCTTDSSDTPISDAEWRGTKTFAVKRNNSLGGTPAMVSEVVSPTPPRRKFSLFSRDSLPTASMKEKASPEDPLTHSQPILAQTNVSEIPPVLPHPTPTTLKHPVAPLSVAGPSESPAESSHAPHLGLEGMIPLAQTTTPPSRPARTDPYKTYGVPVPGSERARAFLKAEKEWIRAEKERRARERTAREGEGVEHVPREDADAGRGSGPRKGYENEDRSGKASGAENEKGREVLCKRRAESLKKHKDPIPEETKILSLDASAEHREETGPANASFIPEKHPTHEFGVLPVQSATSTARPDQMHSRPRSSQGKRGWIFSRRSCEGDGEKEEKRREKKVKEKEKHSTDKDKDHTGIDSAKTRKRPKSRDGPKTSLGFRSKGRGKVKDRGYSSDTGVPSLTYMLM